jgi:hypothetical protein
LDDENEELNKDNLERPFNLQLPKGGEKSYEAVHHSACRIVGGKCHSHCCSRGSLTIAVSPSRHPRAIEIESQGVPRGILPQYVSGLPTKRQLKKGDIFPLITDGFVKFESQ